MKNSKKIAERYAVALFDVSTPANALVPVENDLKNLANLLDGSAEFAAAVRNPLLTRAQVAKIAESVLDSISAHEITKKFIKLLAAQKRLGLLKEIYELFAEKSAALRGEVSAELVVAKKISDTGREKIATALGKTYNKKVNLSVREDAGIIGGTVVRIGSLRLDGSIAGKLNRLKQMLKAA